MFDFLSSCGICSSQPKAGSFAFEAFKKVPNIGSILKQIGGSNFPAIGNMAGGGTTGNLPFRGSNQVDFSQFINNEPDAAIIDSQSNFKQITQDNHDRVIKKVLKSNYPEIVKEHRQAGTKFQDSQFPPDQSSIGNVEGLRVKATWKRIPEVIKNPEFISGKIEPSDIFQGSLGDCYFLSAISALAENDFRVKNLFPSLKMNPQGIYMARVLHNGILKQVVVDDYIPVNQQGQPLFAKPAGGRQIWVMILEKCWAKVNGSYGAIVGGLPNEVLHAFSGAPTFYKRVHDSPQKQKQLWDEMWEADQKGAIFCCGTKADESIEKYGFVKGHAYTIMGLFDSPKKMLKIRNPWGKKEWQGRASDSDTQFWSKIPPQQRQRMGYQQKNDGVFFMLYEDFVNYFDMVDICKINDNANYTNLEVEFNKKNGEMFEFETEGGSATITLAQQSTRGKSDQAQKAGYSRSTIIVGKYQEKSKGYEYKYVESSSSKLFSTQHLELKNLAAGKYVVYAKYNWIKHNPDMASISLYTNSPTNIVKSKQSKHDGFLYKVFMDHARKSQKKQQLGKGNQEWICNDFLLRNCGYGYFAVHLDERSTRKLGVQIEESEYTEKRLNLKKPYRGEGTIKTTVEPGKQLIILYNIKSQNYPTSITLPTPKIYNLVE